ncbi:MAG: sigma 54-interacting transcriptional regulator, partial [Ignavibacteria bacterium]|nr:sigma 54-interacting transcriptional regulator [Ignavibacteria bacterium]
MITNSRWLWQKPGTMLIAKGNILILGDTGTGKELFMNAIVNTGKRNKGELQSSKLREFLK